MRTQKIYSIIITLIVLVSVTCSAEQIVITELAGPSDVEDLFGAPNEWAAAGDLFHWSMTQAEDCFNYGVSLKGESPFFGGYRDSTNGTICISGGKYQLVFSYLASSNTVSFGLISTGGVETVASVPLGDKWFNAATLSASTGGSLELSMTSNFVNGVTFQDMISSEEEGWKGLMFELPERRSYSDLDFDITSDVNLSEVEEKGPEDVSSVSVSINFTLYFLAETLPEFTGTFLILR